MKESSLQAVPIHRNEVSQATRQVGAKREKGIPRQIDLEPICHPDRQTDRQTYRQTNRRLLLRYFIQEGHEWNTWYLNKY